METISYMINSICWIIGFTSALILLIAGTDLLSKKAENRFKAFCRKNVFIQAWLNSGKDNRQSPAVQEEICIKKAQSCGLVLSESPVAGK